MALGETNFGETTFRADTDELDRFAARGARYVVALEELLRGLWRARNRAEAIIGPERCPPEGFRRIGEELVAEAGINNAVVADLSRSLQTPGAEVAAMLAGGVLVGADRPLADDRALLHRLRARPMVAAGVSPHAAAELVTGGAAYRAAMELLAMGVRPDAVSAAGPQRIVDVRRLVGDRPAVRGEGFAAEQLDALLTRSYGPLLDRAVMSGRVAPPDDAARDAVVDAMVAGLAPGDLGVPAVYFPTFYRWDLRLRELIARTEEHREVVDGNTWSWFDHDPAELAAVDAKLDHLHQLRATLGAEHGIGDDGLVEYFAAVTATGHLTAGSSWEGLRYARHVGGIHHTAVSRRGTLTGSTDHHVELVHIGERLAEDPLAAVAFYNRLGVERTADLASLLGGNGLGQEVFDAYGHALAAASTETGASGEPRLAFSGHELLATPKRSTSNGVIWYSPALLFRTGTFDAGFLAGATRAVLDAAERGESQGRYGFIGSHVAVVASQAAATHYRGGEDPRNILLARTAEHPAAVSTLLTALGGPAVADGRAPSANALDSLLSPQVPFQPAVADRGPGHFLDTWAEGVVLSEAGTAGITAAAAPTLRSSYPITDFLAAVATDDVLSRSVLLYSSDAVRTGQPMVQDPGSASGLDLILARHATLMVGHRDLVSASIERTSINDGAPTPITQEHWSAVYREVLRLGRGQALAAAADRLLLQAIGAAVGPDGWFSSEVAVPFAQLAGRTTENAKQALVTYSAGLDEAARRYNQRASAAVGITLAAAGFLPGLGPVTSASGIAWSWFFSGYPTDNELRVRIEQGRISQWQTSGAWEDAVAIEHLQVLTGETGRGELALNLGMNGPTTVAIRRTQDQRDGIGFDWQHPQTGRWAPLPAPSDAGFEKLFGSTGLDETVPLWVSVGESRDLIDDYRGLTDERPWIREWLGPRR